MMDFPSCFGENGVLVADSSSSTVSKASQNAVTCIYKSIFLGKSYLITITWNKNVMGHSLNVEIADLSGQSLCKADVRPSFFSKRKGSKSLEFNRIKIDLYWDLSSAKFESSPEPLEGFYIALVCKQEMILLIGNMGKEALKMTNAVHSLDGSSMMCIAKRENVYGTRVFSTRTQFGDNGPIHNLIIECDVTIGAREPWMLIRVDKKIVMKVKRLQWKFRGNQTFWVDGFPVEVFWDVYNWLFGTGNGVFMFQTRFSKLDGLPNLERFEDCKLLAGSGFSLILYAWKNK
ncbi:uncharacterized protein LOC124938106 [Impatiens glandulifera]|uniref:uncharacterized protein LOC124938106 n=1 Tax=Impatiens glandulifera TaxID=253017 RepID=UPI001FB1401E|nr:uncharacterized protein LOC124938106 [Impatiens glandulifera]